MLQIYNFFLNVEQIQREFVLKDITIICFIVVKSLIYSNECKIKIFQQCNNCL